MNLVLELLWWLLLWHALAKLRLHTENTLNTLEAVTTHLGKTTRAFAKATADLDTRELPSEVGARVRRDAAMEAKRLEKLATKSKEKAKAKGKAKAKAKGKGKKQAVPAADEPRKRAACASVDKDKSKTASSTSAKGKGKATPTPMARDGKRKASDTVSSSKTKKAKSSTKAKGKRVVKD